mmetsp:Transcript_81322/g.230406  ORF Transcript_81322/g.230406 Transcript_81322/m.230406 type:complete len:212 (-) Transcript_81322:31-666(-)
MTDEQAAFDALFAQLAASFRTDGWEVRQETPPAAYLHVSRPGWGDERLNGIHLEAYVLGGQLASRRAPVALHCEAGCPFQERFMALFTERAAPAVRAFPGDWALLGPSGSSVCEVSVPFGETPEATVARIAGELCRLQSLTALIDSTIATCTMEWGQESNMALHHAEDGSVQVWGDPDRTDCKVLSVPAWHPDACEALSEHTDPMMPVDLA